MSSTVRSIVTRHPLRLGINIDHVATVRNARGGAHPDPVRAALLARQAGADGITAHLREDRRHIRDDDVFRLKRDVDLPLNLEIAPSEEMLEIALQLRPHAACLVPERREEVTTEGGLDVIGLKSTLGPVVAKLAGAGIRVSLFIEAEGAALEAAAELQAPVVELHTGAYCHAGGAERKRQLERLAVAASIAVRLGLECHAGHGLDFETVGAVAAIPELRELNIGHFLVGEAVFTGLEDSIRAMRVLIDAARGS